MNDEDAETSFKVVEHMAQSRRALPTESSAPAPAWLESTRPSPAVDKSPGPPDTALIAVGDPTVAIDPIATPGLPPEPGPPRKSGGPGAARRPRWLPMAAVLGVVIAAVGFVFAATRSDSTGPAKRSTSPPVTDPVRVTSPPLTTVPGPPTTTATIPTPGTTVVPITQAPPPTAPLRTTPPSSAAPRPTVTTAPPGTAARFGPSCGHPPGAIIDVFINGQPAGTQTADAAGCIPVQR